MFKRLSFIIFIILISISIYLFINFNIGNNKLKNLKSFLNHEQKYLIKKYIFPFKIISEKEKIISQQDQIISKTDKIISQQEQTISEKDKIISQKDQIISKTDKIISQQDKIISKTEQITSQQEQTISKLKQSKLILEKGIKKLISNSDLEYIEQQEQILLQQGRIISQQQQSIVYVERETNKIIPNLELKFKEKGSQIEILEKSIKLSNNKTLKKYKLTSGFYSGLNNLFPGSGYIDFYENNIFILSSRGVLVFGKNLDNNTENFKQIKNNINEFIGINHFAKNKWFSLKDIFINNNKIFISYTEEIKEDCWNTSIIYGDLNYKYIKFKKFFTSKECIHSKRNIDGEFNALQSGGRIILYDKNHILLSIGDYRSRSLAQDKKSIIGKVVKINIDNNEYEIISMGHRNPQGLLFDKENNFILETEHGPKGGDEINLIEVDKINKFEIQNYGWPISSAGEHYGGKNSEKNKIKYEKYPLYKSHSEHGFIEPLKSFVPSIGISEIVKIGKNRYVVASMPDKSLYYFDINEQKKLINLNRIEVFERVRDLRFRHNKLFLFMEDTASIGVININ